MKLRITNTLILLTQLACFAASAQTNEPIQILPSTNATLDKGEPRFDLVNATVNGTNLFALSLDEITDLFGRPTSVEGPKEIRSQTIGDRVVPGFKTGAQIRYGDLGLYFWFAHPDNEKDQRCSGVIIYLTDGSRDNQLFKAFRGQLSKGVDGNWKAKRVMEAFADVKPNDKSQDPIALAEDANAKQRAQQILAVSGGNNRLLGSKLRADFEKVASSGNPDQLTKIVIERPLHGIEFKYQASATYIEEVVLYKPQNRW